MDKCQNKQKDILLTENERNSLNQLTTNQDNCNYLFTQEIINNNRKLLDFISDKNKLNLQTYFDRKGSEEFLLRKNEAMEKIELDETIDETIINNNKNIEISRPNEEINNKKINKKINKKKSEVVNKDKNLETISEEKFDLRKNDEFRGGSKSVKKKQNSLQNNNKNNNNSNNKEKKDKNILEEESTKVKLVPKDVKENKTLVKRNNKLKEKINNYKYLQNPVKETILSIETIITVDSKLFNEKKDYEHYKRFYAKDEDTLIEEIVNQLKTNNN